jgi:hypothetical protein
MKCYDYDSWDHIHKTSFSMSHKNEANKLECYITLGYKDMPVKKHSSLLGLLISYKENEVL